MKAHHAPVHRIDLRILAFSDRFNPSGRTTSNPGDSCGEL